MAPFDRRFENWPEFCDLFTAMFINNPHISSVEKLYYLRKGASGEVHEICKHHPISNGGFEQAGKELTKHYN